MHTWSVEGSLLYHATTTTVHLDTSTYPRSTTRYHFLLIRADFPITTISSDNSRPSNKLIRTAQLSKPLVQGSTTNSRVSRSFWNDSEVDVQTDTLTSFRKVKKRTQQFPSSCPVTPVSALQRDRPIRLNNTPTVTEQWLVEGGEIYKPKKYPSGPSSAPHIAITT